MIEATVAPTGEPLALDLVNTIVTAPGGDEIDHLATEKGLRSWLQAQHRLGRLVGVRTGDPAKVRALRTHVATAVEAARLGQAPPAPALRALNDALHAAGGYQKLVLKGSLVVSTQVREGDALVAQLAEAAASLLTDATAIGKVRACEGLRCRLLFLPAHPRRRWCSPEVCGNRARVARFYERHRNG